MEAAALGLVNSILNPLFGKLINLLVEEKDLLAGVEDDIQYIIDELKSVDSFMRVLSSRHDHDVQVMAWMDQVRELAYDAEDSTDVFKHRLRRPRHQRGYVGCLPYIYRKWTTCRARRGLATDLKKLKLRARDVSERRARYSHASGGTINSTGDIVIRDDLIRWLTRENQHQLVNELIRWLTKENQPQLGVICLLGSLGSASLANVLYENPAVRRGHFQARARIEVSRQPNIMELLPAVRRGHFQGRARIEVSRQPNIMELLQTMIRQLSNNNHIDIQVGFCLSPQKNNNHIDIAQVVEKIRNYLQDRRYMILLDNISDIIAWNRIKEALPDDENGSRIIVTTCNDAVATACCSHNPHFLYKFPPLSPHRYPWQEVEPDASLERSYRINVLRYYDLPYHLQSCFLYLSIFPKDNDVHRKRLVRRWIAEGLVKGRHGMSEEEVAEGYFDDLINRSFIRESKTGDYGKAKSCLVVEDKMLEVIVAISMEQNFATVLSMDSASIQAHGTIRRLSLQGEVTLKSDLNLSHVRSLTSKDWPFSNYEKVKLLRVLDLEGCQSLSHKHLKNISELFLLTFLSLRNSSIRELPNSIGELHNLQFLDVRGCDIEKLPIAVVKLEKLAYLLGGKKLRLMGSYTSIRLPKGVRKMKGLRNLGLVTVTGSGFLGEIAELTQLKKLSIDFRGAHIQRVDRLSPIFVREKRKFCNVLTKLRGACRSLTLLHDDDDHNRLIHLVDNLEPPVNLQKIHVMGSMGILPVWFNNLRTIAKITLRKTRLGLDAMGVLKTLPELVQLVLGSESFSIRNNEPLHFDRNEGSFRCLKLLQIESLVMNFEQGALRHLRVLKLFGNFQMEIIAGIGHLGELKQVYLDTHSENLQQHIREYTTGGRPDPPNIFVINY